ncbi:hypothetical protein Tco_0970623 [Tanacetum coccineum]
MKTLVVDWINVVIGGMRSEFRSDLTSSLSDWGWLTLVDIGLGRSLLRATALNYLANHFFTGQHFLVEQLTETALAATTLGSTRAHSYYNLARMWQCTASLNLEKTFMERVVNRWNIDTKMGKPETAKCVHPIIFAGLAELDAGARILDRQKCSLLLKTLKAPAILRIDTVQERKTNDELQEDRKELIEVSDSNISESSYIYFELTSQVDECHLLMHSIWISATGQEDILCSSLTTHHNVTTKQWTSQARKSSFG